MIVINSNECRTLLKKILTEDQFARRSSKKRFDLGDAADVIENYNKKASQNRELRQQVDNSYKNKVA